MDRQNEQQIIFQYLQHVRKLYEESSVPVVYKPGHTEERMLPTNDGVRLRTEYCFPEGVKRVPAIVMRCCYKQHAPLLALHAEEYTKRGFAFIIQWCRGMNGSEGKWEPNVNEREDGLALMRYLQADDRIESIGYWGDSYLALTGWVMADAVPEKVKTMYLGVYGCDRFVSAYQDGLFRQDILTSWAMENAGREIRADYLTSAAFRPQIHVDEQLWGGILPWYRDWILNTDRDCSYWTEGFWADLKKIPGKIQIPLYIREGWYDHHLGSAISTYELLSDTAKSQSTFEIGPWNHSYQSVIAHQQTTGLKDNSFVKPLEWFDCILRKGGHPKRTIRRYVIGADCWEVQTVYPVPIDCKTCFYLDATDGKKGLVTSIPVTNACVEYDYDPLDPVFSYGAESLLKSMDKAGSLVQPPSDYRSDVLSFESEPLEKSLQIDGIIRVKLYVASDVEDTAFSVKLMEVFADGTAVNIRGIITTLAYRNGSATRRDYNPGEKVEIELSLWDIAWVLQAGSRLRLDVSSSDFPQYAVHSNYPGIWSEQVETRIAHQTIYTGNFSPSCIELPVVIAEE